MHTVRNKVIVLLPACIDIFLGLFLMLEPFDEAFGVSISRTRCCTFSKHLKSYFSDFSCIFLGSKIIYLTAFFFEKTSLQQLLLCVIIHSFWMHLFEHNVVI